MSIETYVLARQWHDGQMYGDEPYIWHLENVVAKVKTLYQTDENLPLLIRLAYLHDLFEDTSCSESDVRDHLSESGLEPEFLERLLLGMKAISKKDDESRNQYLVRCSTNADALKVKIADTLSNLECSIRTGELRRIKKYANQIERLSKIQFS